MNPEQQYTACVAGLKEFVEGIGGHGVVLGLSGGIDSSLVACMCVDAFGAENVHGYMLPGPYSTEHSLVDAQELARNLGIRAERVSIAEAYRVFESQLSNLCPSFDRSTAGENTQARCRMIVLMALANFYGWTMVNTGNKSEAMMGYSTLYGDTAGAFAPIGGLYKTDVYAVARWRNDHAEARGEEPPIPEHVLVKPPSAELSPGQSDEASLGIAYAELDPILIAAMERGESAEQIAAAGFDRAQVDSVLRRAAAYAFKRALEPPFPDTRFYE